MTTPLMAPVCVGHTDFPLRAGGPQPTRQLPLPQDGLPWRLLDGPPYANGALHLGHVLNKLLKDTSARTAAALGHAVDWTPRWDCHGLPVELQVERQGHGRSAPTTFVPAARAYAQGQVTAQCATFAQLGVAASWASARPTMHPQEQAATLRVLAALVARQTLVMRHQPSPWCPVCASTLAGAEQEPVSLTRTEAVVPFFLADGTAVLSWTTTPWTLPYHAGLVVHPEATYRQVQWGEARAWVSEAAWPQVQRWYPQARLEAAHCSGDALLGQVYRTLWGTTGTVVGDVRVAAEGGTGVLHAVPAFDAFDASVGARHGWTLTEALAEDGTLSGPGAWAAHAGLKAGEAASAATLAALAVTGAPWLHRFQATVEVPGCWRHRVPVLTRPSRQAFLVLTEEVRARAQAMVQGMAFNPPAAQGRMLTLMAQRPDWCVSRQRTWGVPMALVLDVHTGQAHAQAPAVMARVADAVEAHGVEAWWTTPREVWLDQLVDPAEVTWVTDVLDVWFDSGALGVTAGPADLVVEGHDQLRGWFQACVWLAALLDRPAPFARVVTHGFVVDAQGHKLSKSKGGRATQAQVGPAWTDLPADVLRWWALLGDTGADRPWSAVAVQMAQAAYAKCRGTLRFALANVPATQWGQPWTTEGWTDLDVQTRQEADALVQAVLGHFHAGAYDTGARLFLEWVDATVSRQLYGRLKDRLYCAPLGSLARQAAVATLQAMGEVLVALLAVVCPQLVHEALVEVPTLRDRAALPTLTVARPWSAEALAVPLTQAWERLGHKGGLERAFLVLDADLPWPAWAVSEAWGGVRWVRQGHAPVAVAVPTPWGTAWLAPADDPVCPRCRRAAPLQASGVCDPCADVAAGALTWR